MSQMLQPGIILLKEGTDTSQGTPQLISNINACEMIGATVKTTLGPCGMDKLVYSDNGTVTISNDGATVMKLLDIVHPAAKTLVDIARSQDEEVGDGTTSVVVLACEFLTAAKYCIEEGIHPQIIIKNYRQAARIAKDLIQQLSIPIPERKENDAEFVLLLERCASTALNSKLLSGHSAFFSKMVVQAVLKLEADLNLELLGMKKEPGGSVEDSIFVEGVAFKKTFSYAGFECQPKSFKNPKILCLNIELELKAEKENAEIRITDPSKFQSFVDAEWNIIYNKLDAIAKTGAKVILSRLAIGDLATQYFADRDIFCAGRVPGEDLKRVSKATGAAIQTSVHNISENLLGKCGLFEERQVGSQRYNFFTECEHTRTATIILRGGGEHFIDEAERSLHDSIMIVRRTMKHKSIVAGGGACEMEISNHLNEYSSKIAGKGQLIIKGYAKAFEAIPRQLAQNAGFDATDILSLLRKKHASGGKYFGVDLTNESICDCYSTFVWEPSIIKTNCIEAATEAACIILSVDETVKNPKSDSKIPDEYMPGAQPQQRGLPGMSKPF
jgi:T-complex protein 1 subunit eta